MIGFLLKARLSRVFSSISSMRKSNILTYSLVLSLFLIGGFFFFYHLFNFLEPIELIGVIIADKLISYSFFIFFLLLIMSNGITSLSTLYNSEELNFLHSTPILTSDIFTLKLIETVFYSSWATVIGVCPLVISYLAAFRAPFYSFFLIFIPIIAFISIPSGIGVTIILIIKRIKPKITIKQLSVILSVLSGLFIYFYILTTPYSFNVPDTLNLEAVYSFMNSLKVSNPYFANEWFYKCISGLTTDDKGLFLKNITLLLFSGIISITFAILMSNLFYKTGWMSSGIETCKRYIYKKILVNKLPKFLNMIQKDLKVFLRSPLQWSQLMIIVILLIVYSISLRRTPLYVRDPFWLSAIALVNTGFVGYIAATLSLRFVYPQISLEGRSWWILRSSPLSSNLILHSKGIFFFLINLIIGEIVVVSSNIMLVNYSFIVFLSAILTLIFSLVAVLLSISLGTIFADFKESNPAKIASGAGGLITAVLNLIYIAVSLTIFIVPISSYIRAQLNGYSIDIRIQLLLSSIIFTLITVLIVVIPYRIAVNKINAIE